MVIFDFENLQLLQVGAVLFGVLQAVFGVFWFGLYIIQNRRSMKTFHTLEQRVLSSTLELENQKNSISHAISSLRKTTRTLEDLIKDATEGAPNEFPNE